jgi:hypothetical protein
MQLDGSSFSGHASGLLGLPLLHEQPPILPHQQQLESLDARLIADLVAAIAGNGAAAPPMSSPSSGGDGGGVLDGSGRSSSSETAEGEGALSSLVRSLIAGRDSAVQQQASAERRLQEGVALVRVPQM